jgi:hypothetical protein
MRVREFGCTTMLALGLLMAGCNGGNDSANAAPIANAGSAQSVSVGSTVTLDGSASTDADGDALTYAWTLTGKPEGSAATLSSATAQAPTFTPDLAGSYVAKLVVNDGKVSSSNTAAATITAADDSAPITIAASTAGTITTATTLSVTIDEAGTGYYLVQAATAAAPTVEELMSTGTPFDMAAGVAASQSISGLSANTQYTVYFVAKDSAGNVQAAVQSVPVMTTCVDDYAAILPYAIGTAAPPAVLGSHTMQPFDQAAQVAIANLTAVTTIPGSPIPGDLTLATSATKRSIGNGWSTWSHGYTGVVYFSAGTENTLTLPAGTRAVYLYVEPNNLGNFDLTVTASPGSTCGTRTVNGSGGAVGYGFAATDETDITSIKVTAAAGAAGFAIGEFAVSD